MNTFGALENFPNAYSLKNKNYTILKEDIVMSKYSFTTLATSSTDSLMT